METGSFANVSPKEKRQRILIVFLGIAVTALVCAGIWKLAGPFNRMKSDLKAWQKGEITASEIKTKLGRFILEDDYVRQEWAAKKLIAMGIPGSEPIIVSVLTDYTGKPREVAVLMLNCGNEYLSEFARRWAAERGYEVKIERASPRVTWGK